MSDKGPSSEHKIAGNNRRSFWRGPLAGAAFLMATSAIGPGFLNNTSLFTKELLSSFGFVILISVLLDIGVQFNIWRIITVSGQRAQQLSNDVIPGLGYILSILVTFGGLAFNVGNIAGCGLGLEVLTGLDTRWGAIISCCIALLIFWSSQAGKLIDIFVKFLGMAMIGLTLYVMFSSDPPLAKAIRHTFWPETINIKMIVALVGGTVGGYISFAGAHRLLDAGFMGTNSIRMVDRSAVTGIVLTSIMRYVLFLATLGVVWSGSQLSGTNPAASVFQLAAGDIGYRFFGVVLWAAAITSVIGASYTSISFWKISHPSWDRRERLLISAFIVLSTLLFVFLRQPPAGVLVTAGALNGIILPVALGIILIAAARLRNTLHYRHPIALLIAGWLVVAIMSWMGAIVIRDALKGFL